MEKNNSGSTSKVLLNSGFYIFSALIVDAIGFVLLPIYLYFLDSAEYGKVSIANGFVDVAIIIAALSLHMAVSRFYADYKDDTKKVARYYGSIILFVSLISVAFSVLCLLLRSPLEKFVFEGIGFYPVIFLVIISIPFRTLRYVHRAILRGMQQGLELAIVNLIVFILQAALTLLFIGYLKLGAEGMLLSALVVHVLYTAFIFIDLGKKKMFTLAFDRDLIKQSLKYSIPIMPHNLSSYIATLFSRVVLNGTLGTSSVGLYSVATQFGLVLDMVESSANNALTPWFFSYKNDKSATQKELSSLIKLLAALYGLCMLGIGAFSEEIILIFTSDEYSNSWKIIPVLVTAYGIKAVYFFFLNILLYYKKASKKLFLATVFGNLINVIVAALTTSKLGMYGPAVAIAVSQIFVGGVVYVISRRYDKESILFKDLAPQLIIAFIFMVLCTAPSYLIFDGKLSVVNVAIKVVAVLIYIAISYFNNKSMIHSFAESIFSKIRKKKS